MSAIKKEGVLFYESKTVEWFTPKSYIDLAIEVMGKIDLDPASCEEANKIIGADKFYSERGTELSWNGCIWLNPPYGKSTKIFIEKLLCEWQSKHISQAVILLNNNVIDRKWFMPLWKFPICFHYGRVKFTSPGIKTTSPPIGQIFIYLGNREEHFIKTFSNVGAIMKEIIL